MQSDRRVDKGKLYSYDTNYAGYLELKAQREEMAQATELKRQNILRTELAWVQRGARARSTKQKARLERYEELKNRQGAGDGRTGGARQHFHAPWQDDPGSPSGGKGIRGQNSDSRLFVYFSEK